jgi:hypothetical protein
MQMPPEPLEKDFYDELLIAMGAVVSVSSSMVSVRLRVYVRAPARLRGSSGCGC